MHGRITGRFRMPRFLSSRAERCKRDDGQQYRGCGQRCESSIVRHRRSYALGDRDLCEGSHLSVNSTEVESLKEIADFHRRNWQEGRGKAALTVHKIFDYCDSARKSNVPITLNGASCQSAFKFDPASASNFDPFGRRVLAVALAPSELVGVAETVRARAA